MSRCDDSPDGKRMYKDVRDNEYKELCRDVRDMQKKTGADGLGWDELGDCSI